MADIISVHFPLPFSGIAAILAALSGRDAHAPRGIERLPVIKIIND